MPNKNLHNCDGCKMSDKNPFCKSAQDIRRVVSDVKEDLFLKKGAQIAAEDLRNGYIFMVRDGVLKKWLRHENAESLNLVYAGQFVGCPSGRDVGRFRVMLSAATDTQLCALKQDAVMTLLAEHPTLLSAYLSTLHERLDTLRIAAAQAPLSSAKQHCAEMLYQDFKARGQNFRNKLVVTKILSQSEWAVVLKTRRETVSRIFSELEAAGIISTSPGSITLENESKMLLVTSNLAA